MDRVSNKQSMSFSATTSIINFRKRRRPYRKQLDSHSESKVRANETEKKARSEIYIYFFFTRFLEALLRCAPMLFFLTKQIMTGGGKERKRWRKKI